MSSHKFSLPQPDRIDGTAEDGSVLELARVWVCGGQPEIIVRPAFDDPKIMGQMLAELCWNFAHAYERRGGMSAFEALDKLREGWAEGHRLGDAVNPRSPQ